MHRWKLGFFISALFIGLPFLQGEVQAQRERDEELEELLQESEEEERDLREILDTGLPTPGEEAPSGRVALPIGEEAERLRISQDREVDPDTYIVGPGDAFILYIWGELDIPYELIVDPEGNVHLPTIGLFHISEKTLTEAKTNLVRAAAEKYPGARITVTLSSLRFFTVFLTGAVSNRGSIIVHPVTRVSDLVERAGLSGSKKPAGTRSIQLIHRDATVDTVDLSMFLATGDVEYNPYVRMGDILHASFQKSEIFAFGAVFKEEEWEYRPGDTIGDLIRLSGGLQPNALLEESEIWRFREDGVTSDILYLSNYAKPGLPVTLDDVEDMPLEPQDMLFIRSLSEWKQTPTVSAFGALTYTGRFRIIAGKTRLSDIIARAGGFTDKAYLAQSKLVRAKYRAIKDPELVRLQALQRVSATDLNPEDRAYLKTKARQDRGRVAVDFERLFQSDGEDGSLVDFERFASGDFSENILLEGGDVIFVPTRHGTVSLSGQFENPGLIDFEKGRTVGYYLEKAGGFTWNANKGEARIIQARTGLRKPLEKNLVVEEGDEIWVPENEYRDWWGFVQSTVRTLAEALTLIVVVRSF